MRTHTEKLYLTTFLHNIFYLSTQARTFFGTRAQVVIKSTQALVSVCG